MSHLYSGFKFKNVLCMFEITYDLLLHYTDDWL